MDKELWNEVLQAYHCIIIHTYLPTYILTYIPIYLQVMLASDPTTDMASASMNIHAGHFQDPDELAGLAHFHVGR